MRVASRHLRLLIGTFADQLSAETHPALLEDLRWLTGELGKARDADVCELDIARITATLPAVPDLERYAAYLRASHLDAYRHLREALSSERYGRLIQQLQREIQYSSIRAAEQQTGKPDIGRHAKQRIRAAARRVYRRGQHLDAASPAAAYHRLRISAKKLRYLLDFFSNARPRKWRKAIAALEQLQTLLGEHQDAAMASARHTAFAARLELTEQNRDLLLTMGRLLQIEADRSHRSRERFQKAWKRYQQQMPCGKAGQ